MYDNRDRPCHFNAKRSKIKVTRVYNARVRNPIKRKNGWLHDFETWWKYCFTNCLIVTTTYKVKFKSHDQHVAVHFMWSLRAWLKNGRLKRS